jgi:transcriptional regulator with XRE-family HTH domain
VTKKSTVHHGSLLQALIDWVGLSQQKFADKIGLSRKTINGLLSDERISQKNLIKIAKAHRIPIEYFRGEIDLKSIQIETTVELAENKQADALLQEKVSGLQEELLAAQRKIIELQSELLKYHIFPESTTAR